MSCSLELCGKIIWAPVQQNLLYLNWSSEGLKSTYLVSALLNNVGGGGGGGSLAGQTLYPIRRERKGLVKFTYAFGLALSAQV